MRRAIEAIKSTIGQQYVSKVRSPGESSTVQKVTSFFLFLYYFIYVCVVQYIVAIQCHPTRWQPYEGSNRSRLWGPLFFSTAHRLPGVNTPSEGWRNPGSWSCLLRLQPVDTCWGKTTLTCFWNTPLHINSLYVLLLCSLLMFCYKSTELICYCWICKNTIHSNDYV